MLGASKAKRFWQQFFFFTSYETIILLDTLPHSIWVNLVESFEKAFSTATAIHSLATLGTAFRDSCMKHEKQFLQIEFI